MCHIFAQQPQENYESVTRSIRIGGHITSVRLENTFWRILDDIAASEGTSVAKFITTLHDEVLLCHGEVQNLASLLRCSCLLYVSRKVNEPATSTTGHLVAAE
ncbi:ribbon-helix-helix domain-containing protein [Azorhizobium doebereinerae]|uniref:ribbon-helix-helix domain-containing protein n=1 Tax=Azorhizobium doebereinerae TaxID=281091 RepID=UPI0004186DB2|nr:ribbon-helix-helix domain-containing protein [Azorhizobium doebereinerae]